MLTIPVRLGLFFTAVFLVHGLYLPYWPVWLAAQGLSEREVAWLVAAGLLIRVVSVPLVGALADGLGTRRRLMAALAVLAFISFAAFALADGFVALFAITILSTALYPALLPMIETVSVQAAGRGEVDYGRVRTVGSAAFVVANVAGGLVLERLGAPSILIGVLAFLALTAAVALLLPADPPRAHAPGGRRAGWGSASLEAVAASPLFWLFVVSVGLIQGAHGLYYSFGSIHWAALGLSGGMIGVLWAVGVVAEMLLFLFIVPVLRRVDPMTLILIGAGGAALRWAVMAFDPPLWLLFPAQALHAFSFGAVHVGALYLVDRAVPAYASVTAQSVVSAFSHGIIVGLITLVSGDLYAAYGGLAYGAMGLLALLGGAGIMLLRVLWRTEHLVGEAPR